MEDTLTNEAQQIIDDYNDHREENRRKEEEAITATHNALTSIIGRALNFEIAQARKLAFEILQDVNDHAQARQVAKLLGLSLKPHELE